MTVEGSRAKLRRAKEHLDHIEAEITQFLNAEPYSVTVERPTKTVAVVRVTKVPDRRIPVEDWALIIGDCVHNARASIDYIAWQLAGADMNDRATMFPIFDTPEGWRDNHAKRIKRLPLCAKAMIKEVQPCFYGKDRSALAALRILDDADKHKLLTVTAVVQDKIHINLLHINARTSAATRVTFYNLPLHYGTVLATVVLPDFAPPENEVEASFTPAIAFGESVANRTHIGVIQTLKNIVTTATIIVDNFDGRFFGGYGRTYFYGPSHWKIFRDQQSPTSAVKRAAGDRLKE